MKCFSRSNRDLDNTIFEVNLKFRMRQSDKCHGPSLD